MLPLYLLVNQKSDDDDDDDELDKTVSELHVSPNTLSEDLRYSNEFVCVEVLPPSQPNGVMSSAVSLPNHTFTGQA